MDRKTVVARDPEEVRNATFPGTWQRSRQDLFPEVAAFAGDFSALYHFMLRGRGRLA